MNIKCLWANFKEVFITCYFVKILYFNFVKQCKVSILLLKGNSSAHWLKVCLIKLVL